jgi:hypothetical protein
MSEACFSTLLDLVALGVDFRWNGADISTFGWKLVTILVY